MPATKPEIEIRGLARMARRAASGEVTRRAHLAGREQLIAAVDRGAPARSWRSLRFAIAAAALLAVAALVLFVRRPAPAITFVVEGAAASDRYVEAGPSGAVARFSEGTVIALSPGARGRVATATPRGARVSLEAGSARFDVVHRAGTEWTVEAGPFTVAVTGTSFDLAWSGAELTIAMHEGSVVLRGPPAPDGIALRAGQRLVADAHSASVSRVEAAAAAPSTAAVAAPAAAPSASAPAPIKTARAAEASWRARVAGGDYAGVIADAEARGIDAALEGSALPDLAALADAARYAGRGDLAQRALVAERTRFPASAEARSAAFLLGRLAESRSPAAAVTWYDLYLTEAPNGPLAAEALGRKMLAIKASSGPTAARPAAEEYHRRFPNGPFAPMAAEILGGP